MLISSLMILGLVTCVCVVTLTNVSGMNYTQNIIANTSKVDYKVLQTLEKVSTQSDNYHTLVDVILENSTHAPNLPNDTVTVYSTNNTVGVAADYDQIIKLAGLGFVQKITAPKGVFPADLNASIINPPSPLVQYNAGIVPIYVKCKYGFDLLVMQRSDNKGIRQVPACFTWNDEVKAQDRGIGKIVNNLVKTKYFDLYGVLPTRESFSMAPNSTSEIFVKYFPNYKNNNTRDLRPLVFSGYDTNGIPIPTPNVTISAKPDIISDNRGQNTTVTYTITTTTSGLYWLDIPSGTCGNDLYPLTVGIAANGISSADVATYLGTMHCPSADMGSQITGFSGTTINWLYAEPLFN